MAEIKVRFKQSYYSGEQFFSKGDVHTFPADTPIPTRDIEILEGKSTYEKPLDQSAVPVTKMNKDVAQAVRDVQTDKAAAARAAKAAKAAAAKEAQE